MRMSVLADAMKAIYNAEKRGKKQVRGWPVLGSETLGVARAVRPLTCPRTRPSPSPPSQVLIRPASKVIVRFLEVMQKHGACAPSRGCPGARRCQATVDPRARQCSPPPPLPSLSHLHLLAQSTLATLRLLTTTGLGRSWCSSLAASTSAASCPRALTWPCATLRSR
jgi:hypothetical protein